MERATNCNFNDRNTPDLFDVVYDTFGRDGFSSKSNGILGIVNRVILTISMGSCVGYGSGCVLPACRLRLMRGTYFRACGNRCTLIYLIAESWDDAQTRSTDTTWFRTLAISQNSTYM